MKLIVDIDEDLFVRLFDNGDNEIDDMAEALVALRKGTPAPKGKWKKLTHNARPYRKCSNCGDELLDDFSTRWDYCPTCGAYMKGRE